MANIKTVPLKVRRAGKTLSVSSSERQKRIAAHTLREYQMAKAAKK